MLMRWIDLAFFVPVYERDVQAVPVTTQRYAVIASGPFIAQNFWKVVKINKRNVRACPGIPPVVRDLVGPVPHMP